MTLHPHSYDLCAYRFGPLIRSWCMRYEAKNKYFKIIVGNFINIGKTVAIRHQRYMCYKMECTLDFLGGENSYGHGTHICTSTYI